MKLKRRHLRDEEVSFSSMADLAFLLIIFFMVTAGFVADKGVIIKLPETATQEDIPQRSILISITAKEEIFIDGEPAKLKAIQSYVKQEIAKDPGKFVVIKCDKEARYKIMMDVIDELTQADIVNIALPTGKEEEL